MGGQPTGWHRGEWSTAVPHYSCASRVEGQPHRKTHKAVTLASDTAEAAAHLLVAPHHEPQAGQVGQHDDEGKEGGPEGAARQAVVIVLP